MWPSGVVKGKQCKDLEPEVLGWNPRSTGLESQALPPVAFLAGHSAPLGLRLLFRVCISGSLWLKGELNAKNKEEDSW